MSEQSLGVDGFASHFVGEHPSRDAVKFTREADNRDVAMIVELPRREIADDPFTVLHRSAWQVWICLPYGSWSIADCRPHYETKAQAMEFVSLLLKAKAFDWVTPSDYLDHQENYTCIFYAPKDRTHRAILLGVIFEDRYKDDQPHPVTLDREGKIERHSQYHDAFESLVRHYASPENQLL